METAPHDDWHWRETQNAWVQGGEVFARLAHEICPHIAVEAFRPLAEYLCASPALADWDADKHAARRTLMTEGTVMAMLVQAWNDRADIAVVKCKDADAMENYTTAGTVLHSAVRYLPGAPEVEQ